MDYYDRDVLAMATVRLWNRKHKAATRTIFWFLRGEQAIYRGDE